jgi:hypothetical protein
VGFGGRDDSLGPGFLAALHCDRPEAVRTVRKGGLLNLKDGASGAIATRAPKGTEPIKRKNMGGKEGRRKLFVKF